MLADALLFFAIIFVSASGLVLYFGWRAERKQRRVGQPEVKHGS